VPTDKRADKSTPEMGAGRWRPTEKRGYEEYEFQTWAYDPSKQVEGAEAEALT
jgi:hypothetical protein